MLQITFSHFKEYQLPDTAFSFVPQVSYCFSFSRPKITLGENALFDQLEKKGEWSYEFSYMLSA